MSDVNLNYSSYQALMHAFNQGLNSGNRDDLMTSFNNMNSKILGDQKDDQEKIELITASTNPSKEATEKSKKAAASATANTNSSDATEATSGDENVVNPTFLGSRTIVINGIEYTIEKTAVKDNQVTITVKDAQGQDINAVATFDNDGNYTLQSGDDPRVSDTYYKNPDGSYTMVQSSSALKDGTVSVYSYDIETGKLNQQYIRDKNGVETTVKYDDNGAETQRIVDDGVNIITTQYEYYIDSNGQMQKGASYTVTKNINSGEQSTTTTLFKEDGTKTSYTTTSDGTQISEEYDADGNLISEKTVTPDGIEYETKYSKAGDDNDKTTRNSKTVKTYIDEEGKTCSQTIYNVDTLDENGNVIERNQYTDEAHTQKFAKTIYRRNRVGYVVSETIQEFNTDGTNGKKTTKKYPNNKIN